MNAVASGLNGAQDDPAAVARFGLDTLAAIAGFSRDGEPHLQMRVGIHCGPVVAGIVGKTRFVYDVWGDTVNTAARMESHGVPGAVQVSDAVRERLGDRFDYEARGRLPVKGNERCSSGCSKEKERL